MNRLSVLALALAGVLGACQQEVAEETGSTEAAVAADPAAIEQEIRQLTDEWEAALNAHDTARLGTLYDADAIAQYPGQAPRVGAEAIRGAWDEMLAMVPDATGTADTEQVIVSESGDLVVELGSYSVTGTSENEPFDDRGSYVTVWKNIGGEWKIVAESTTPAVLPAAAEATTS